uniref:Type II GnRH receptor n=1 Tax=Latimeria chalumnae TaxID=7897 RepID=H3B0A3_LATCH
TSCCSNSSFISTSTSITVTLAEKELQQSRMVTNSTGVYENELLLLPTFTTASKVRVGITFVLFVVSACLNLAVLHAAVRNDPGKKSHVRMLIINLCCTDLLVTFVVMPLDALWNTTVQWYAGNPACKLLMFFKLFSMYSCAFVTTVISIDRYCIILYPLTIGSARQRNRIILISAWVLSATLAVPQLIFFHTTTISVPATFTQCITHGSFPKQWQEKAYFLFTFLWLFLLPFIIMIFCYTCILISITRKMKTAANVSAHSKEAALRCTRNYIPVVRMKTLKMTIVLISTFIVCWTPYYVLGFWYVFFPEMINNQTVPESINHVLFLFGLLNSSLDPLV